jgi:hypothetical protein
MRAASAVSLLLLAACTDASLYGKVGQQPPVANKLALTGVLCTDNPIDRKFPVKIMFIVDSSISMAQAAPRGEHVTAIQAALSQYLPLDNVYVGMIRYDSQAKSLIQEMIGQVSSGFTRDPIKFTNALMLLRQNSGTRNFQAGLSLARSIITGDAFQADKGPLSRTKYVVVHVTSGSPDPPVFAQQCEGVFPTPPANCEVALLQKEIRDLRDQVLGLGAAEFAFHVVYLEQPHVEGPPCDPRAGNAQCFNPAVTCIQTGSRPDIGRCAQLCVPGMTPCTAFPGYTVCETVDTVASMMSLNVCQRGETECFDGKDNDRNGRGLDCSNLNLYPYDCTAASNPMCEPNCDSACRSEVLGQAMSFAAGGKYIRFESAEQTNFVAIDFRSTQERFVVKEFLVHNRNVIAHADHLYADSDGDGLSDEEEMAIGTNPLLEDTDGDQFNDRLEHLLTTLGLDPLKTSTIANCPDPTLDTDGDGLRDCEEMLLGSDKTLFDTDADGFPDAVEFRVGTNLLSDDVLEDLDLDGVNNGREVREHTDVLSNDSMTRSELAYRIKLEDLGATSDMRTCYNVRISNITLLDELDTGTGTGVNNIDVYFGQVPQGALASFGIFHVASIRVQYFPPNKMNPAGKRIPDTPVLDLKEDDFVLFEQ